MNILKIADVKQLADSFSSEKQKKLLWHLQEVCDITDSQHLLSEKKSDIVQKQDTEPTVPTESIVSAKQPCQHKPKVNLSSTHQSTWTEHGEHSEHFADEFKYDSVLQSHEWSLDYLILSNLCKTMKTVRTAETFRVNKISVLYTVMTDQTSESQLDDYYMNTVMKLILNIAIKYKLSLEKEKSTWEEIQYLSDKSE